MRRARHRATVAASRGNRREEKPVTRGRPCRPVRPVASADGSRRAVSRVWPWAWLRPRLRRRSPVSSSGCGRGARDDASAHWTGVCGAGGLRLRGVSRRWPVPLRARAALLSAHRGWEPVRLLPRRLLPSAWLAERRHRRWHQGRRNHRRRNHRRVRATLVLDGILRFARRRLWDADYLRRLRLRVHLRKRQQVPAVSGNRPAR